MDKQSNAKLKRRITARLDGFLLWQTDSLSNAS